LRKLLGNLLKLKRAERQKKRKTGREKDRKTERKTEEKGVDKSAQMGRGFLVTTCGAHTHKPLAPGCQGLLVNTCAD
jgi:hypothetical protein